MNLKTDKKLKQLAILLLLIMAIASYSVNLFSQNSQYLPTRQSSFEAFSKGNYEQAYKEFSQLLVTYSKDPLYKYYSGVCLIKLNKKPGEALVLLQQALENASLVKSLPSDALYYLGRAQQMSGKFTEAVGSYNSYTKQVGKKTAKEQNVPELIQQCNDQKGEISDAAIKPTEIVKNDNVEVDQKENKPLVKEAIPQTVTRDTSVKVNISPGYEKILDQALVFQSKADSVSGLASEKKKDLEKLPNSQKAELKAKISELELLAAAFQKSADQKYNEAKVLMNPGEEKTPDKVQPATNTFSKDTVKKVFNNGVESKEKQSEKKDIKINDKQADTTSKAIPSVAKHTETYSYFEVLPKPVSDLKEKIAIDPVVPEGLIYRIQIGVFRNPVSYSFFKGIIPVYGFKIAGTDKIVYSVGMFRRFSDATKALGAVKAKGFKDSFVVALSGNKPVSSERALILEKEWGKRPFINIMKPETETSVDTVPPALAFRVEVIRSVKPVKEDILEGINKMVGNRGMDIITLDDGNIVYLIGKFITFESAAEYSDLLNRNGYREAHVVAWLGKKEIAVDTARQLFENMK
jgi:hypothetical protein